MEVKYFKGNPILKKYAKDKNAVISLISFCGFITAPSPQHHAPVQKIQEKTTFNAQKASAPKINCVNNKDKYIGLGGGEGVAIKLPN